MRWLLLIIILASSSCGSAGDFCRKDSDCPKGLICAAKAGQRGVCTYKVKDAGYLVD